MAQLGSSLSAETETLSNVRSLMEAFRAFDSDNDGAINAAELGGILSSLGYNASEQDVRAMMREGDGNKDGLLCMEEFLEMNTKDMELGELANCLNTAFQAIEVQGDEVLTATELYEVMGNLGMGQHSLEDCQSVVASMDADGDGAVTLEDFKLILNALLD
ncbi:6-phosphogluconolactonase [Hibiscus syriacus]|uniref:6-phosphogluconolactonase n=1 Tax=Hibiscus syriacus TaxID=106335 RepID=A0A6A2Y3C4_HIBSY|nr:probable calcium-binding protein CML29 [Hibiscus syriacus]KAE8666619.1 6-phosphogluconolactonase [Hibiscus syriacus]